MLGVGASLGGPFGGDNRGDRQRDGHESTLTARYRPGTTDVLLTGAQAVGRLLAEQHVRDASSGLRTGTLVSGYPGSPLAGLDRTLARARSLATDHDIHLRPALNEELAATQVWGSQQEIPGQPMTRDGVVGVWYGKSPGLDRAGDALRHGNTMGASPRGGVLVLVGDDPGAKSSTLPSASERTLAALGMPVLFPRNSEEIVTLGLFGIALSRASGCWVAMKLTADVAEGFSSLHRDPGELVIRTPELIWQGEPWTYQSRGMPAPPASLLAERDLAGPRWAMVQEFARSNPINGVDETDDRAWLGLVAPGKTYDDLDQALLDLSLDAAARRRHGLRLLRLGLVSPLVSSQIRSFARGLSRLAVIEEKAPFVERQVRDRLYGTPDAPPVIGRRDEQGDLLVPADGELGPDRLREPLRRLLGDRVPLPPRREEPAVSPGPLPVARTPYFCSGCPHNRSTVVPEGSLAGGGIGCHSMVALLPRESSAVTGLTQMGGEGAQWIGQSLFRETPHIFQNMGDGTYFHSGQLAIQACVSAGVNITFKILYNSTIAMTGGQDPQGVLDVAALTRKLTAEGVRRIIVCTDEPGRYPSATRWGEGVDVWDRDRLDEAQRRLRETPGVTVLIYDQQCAAEARRERKRGLQPKESTRVVIDERVCEGCGDCGRKSNCLSVQPVETEFGRKTRIDQATCNFDYSCLDGNCPAFVTVEVPPDQDGRSPLTAPAVEDPEPGHRTGTTNVVLVGIGGTGVVTANQVLAMAALLDGRRVKGVDQTGLSQKAGPVTSHLRISDRNRDPEPAGRIGKGRTDCLLAFDLLSGSGEATLARIDPDRTRTFASTTRTPTGRMIFDPSTVPPDEESLVARLRPACQNLFGVDARAASETLTGEAVTANLLLIGAAVQAGALPISPASVERAIGLNGVAVHANRAAFRWGRVAVADPRAFDEATRTTRTPPATPASSPSSPYSHLLEGEPSRVVEIRAPYLVEYQGERLARRYVEIVEAAWRAERDLGEDTRFSQAVARGTHHLMAYKDEYEVARLLVAPDSRGRIESEVPGARRIRYWLHPPFLRALGLDRKIRFGPVGKIALRMLALGRRLRGTPLDPFGWARMRRLERALVEEYVGMVEELAASLSADTYETAVQAAEAALLVRGFEEIKLANVERYHGELQRLGLRPGGDAADTEAAA